MICLHDDKLLQRIRNYLNNGWAYYSTRPRGDGVALYKQRQQDLPHWFIRHTANNSVWGQVPAIHHLQTVRSSWEIVAGHMNRGDIQSTNTFVPGPQMLPYRPSVQTFKTCLGMCTRVVTMRDVNHATQQGVNIHTLPLFMSSIRHRVDREHCSEEGWYDWR